MASLVERQVLPLRRLTAAVATVRRRWRLRHVLTGATIATGVTALVLAVASLVMQQLGFSADSIIAARVAVGAALIGATLWWVVLPWVRPVSDERVALYVEERIPQLDGALVSAVEAARQDVPDAVRSVALADGLLRSATDQLRRHGDAQAVDAPGLRRGAMFFVTALVATAALFTVGPEALRQGARLVLTPWKDAEAAVPYSIGVEPGNAAVPRGADQQISADLRGFRSDLVELLVRRGSGDEWERIAMERGSDSAHFKTRLFDVDQDAEYLVESNGVRSSVFRLTVKNLPAVKQLDLELRYPSYTGLAPEKVEGAGDIAAVIGTRAIVSVQTTLPISGGRLVVEGDSSHTLQKGPDGIWRGDLLVRRDGFYRVELMAEDGTRVAGAVDYVIDALDDAPPSIRFTKPGRDTRPTMTDEVLVEMEATDDYGVGAIDLQYSVNGGATQSIRVQDGGRRVRDVVAGHTFFLEEMNLKAGDVVSYWATAADAGTSPGQRSSTTDIYFLTIRPFGRDYRQNQQGGGGGQGGGGQENPGTLTQQQREIVAATFKTNRDSARTPGKQYNEDVTTILMSESKLRDRVEKLAKQMQRGVVQQADSNFRVIAELLPQAAREMAAAEAILGARKTSDALPPEQRALRFLEQAEAVYREVQVSRNNGAGGGGGGGQQSSADELADLFELETDKLRNQYEEVRRGNEQAQNQQVDEALERLKQLAARQQQENERQRQQAQQGASGGGGGGGQRQLADEAEEMARQLERLARERQNEQMAESARRLQEAATAMRRSAAASGDAGRASGAAAADRMERARRLLEEGRRNDVTKGTQDAQRRAEELVQRQQEVARDVGSLPRAGSGRPEKEQQLDQRKQGLVDDVSRLEEDLDRLSRDTRRERPDVARQLQDAANAIRDGRVGDKIRFSRGLMRQGSPEANQNFEEQITNDLESVRDRIASAANGAAADSVGKRERALDRAQSVVRGLSSIDDRMRERESGGSQGTQPGREGQPGQNQQSQQGQTGQSGQAGQQGAQSNQSGQQSGSQAGQAQGAQQQQGGQRGQQGAQGSSGQSGQSAQQQGQQGQNGQQGGGGDGSGQQGQGGQRGLSGGRGGMTPQPGSAVGGPGGGIRAFSAEDIRQFSRELRGQREDAEALRRELAATGRPTTDLDKLIARLRAIESERAFQNPGELATLRSAVVEGFKEFEFSLRREFGDTDVDRPTLGGNEDVPAGYRELVNEYFRSLARRSQKPLPPK